MEKNKGDTSDVSPESWAAWYAHKSNKERVMEAEYEREEE